MKLNSLTILLLVLVQLQSQYHILVVDTFLQLHDWFVELTGHTNFVDVLFVLFELLELFTYVAC